MAGYCQGTERTKMPPVLESDQAEGNNDEENGFFMNMPSKEERRVAAESDCSNESIPVRTGKQPHEGYGLK